MKKEKTNKKQHDLLVIKADKLERWVWLLDKSGINSKGKVRNEIKQFLENRRIKNETNCNFKNVY